MDNNIKEIIQRVSLCTQRIKEEISLSVYYNEIRAIEELMNVKIRVIPSDVLEPSQSIVLKMNDGTFMLRYMYLSENSSIKEIDQVHIAVGHELGHICLKHEFITNVVERVSSVLIDEKSANRNDELNENLEADVFSVLLFCQYVRRTFPHYQKRKYTARHIFKLLPSKTLNQEQLKILSEISNQS